MSLPQIFGPLAPEQEALLSSCLKDVQFKKDTVIFESGADGDAAYIIDAGEVRIELENPELDSDAVLRFMGPGTVLGEVALLDRQKRSAKAVAHTDVKARMIGAGALDELAKDHPAFVLQVVRGLARDATSKLRSATAQLSEYMLGGPQDPEVEEMVAKATAAQEAYAGWSEDKVDGLLGALTEAFVAHAEELAIATVKETHLGNAVDKTLKNKVASYNVFRSLVGKVGAGPVTTDETRKVTEIASPVGVVFGLVPMTNPVATAFFKTLITLKSRNALILSFHHTALGVGNRVGEIVRGVLTKLGAPAELVQWVKQRSNRKKTVQFMGHKGVGLILATGGAAMVRAAYSSGNPALGVGPGNAPCWIAPDADPDQAAQSVVLSKSFDNGLICGAEHNLVVDESIRAPFIAALERAGAAVLTPEETKIFSMAAIDPKTQQFRGQMVGQSAELMCNIAQVKRAYPIKLIVVPATWNGEATPWAGEKMSPVLSLFTVKGDDAAIDFCTRLLDYMGSGHTSIIHSKDPARIARFGARMPASRILVNSPGAHGVVGLTSGLMPSLTLGCGTFGGNSTTDNVSYRNLTNIKRLAHFLAPEPPPNVAENR
jgi:acyl-CoA reductase-like NAD-dependent aldehyde dehydrogenase